MFEALIKIGGSLYGNSRLRANVEVWASLAGEYRLLILPGGGPFADEVRRAGTRLNLSNSTAHWMAILAMDQYAYLLADLTPGTVLVRDMSAAATVCTAGKLAILAPSGLLLQQDPLPHSWQVTSDSIAAWLAGYARIKRLVLLKSVAGIFQTDTAGKPGKLLPQISRQALTGYNIVDSHFARTLSPSTVCWIVDGGQPERLVELLRNGSTVGTQVVEA